MDSEEEKTRFVLDRNEILEKGDVDEFIEFIHKHKLPSVSNFLAEKYPNVTLDDATKHTIYEIAMNGWTLAADVSDERKMEAMKWLAERGLLSTE